MVLKVANSREETGGDSEYVFTFLHTRSREKRGSIGAGARGAAVTQGPNAEGVKKNED